MNIYKIFEILDIKYQEVKHSLTYDLKEEQAIKKRLKGTGTKTLFLKDKRGTYFLVVLEESRTTSLKTLAQKIYVSELLYASEVDVFGLLRIEKGIITPFSIVDDLDSRVILVIDNKLRDKKVLVRTNLNDRTVALEFNDFIEFLTFIEHKIIYI